MTPDDYDRAIRRAIEAEDDVTAEALAVELDALLGALEPKERVQRWGVDA